MKNILFTLISLLTFTASAQTSLYVCKDGSYTSLTNTAEILFDGENISIKDNTYNVKDIDSILFNRPSERLLEINFADFIAKGHTIERIFIKSNDGSTICTNNTMKDNKAASSNASDVGITSLPEGQSKQTYHLGNTEYKNGFTITMQYDNGKLLSACFTEAMPRTTFHRTLNITEENATLRNNWMATIPSKVYAHMLTIPGAHDAATKNCVAQSRCQSISISELLASGIRALDLRPRYTASKESDIQLDNLEIYHGITATGVLFKDAMADIVSFLDANPTEMVYINLLKEKASGTDYSSTWRTSIRTCLQKYGSHVVQKLTATLTLGDCRGKMLVVSHNPYGEESNNYGTVYGALTASWGDDATFTTDLNYTNSTKITTAAVTDQYNTTKTADKQAVMSSNLTAASNSTAGWYLSFMNVAYKLFGSNPEAYAKTHNAWLSSKIQEGKTWNSRLGIVFFDFCASDSYTPSLVQDILQQNYRYIY